MRFEKWSVLAGLRFILATIVAINHMPDYIPIGPILSIVPRFGAFEAVLGFLLISGFSIASSYLKEPGGFLVRRAQRIYPIYVASVALFVAAFAVTGGGRPSFWELLVNLVFLNQIVTDTSFVGPSWSLALEIWFYCLTPLLFRLAPATLQKWILASFLAFLVHTVGRTLFHWHYYSGIGFGLNLVLLGFAWVSGLRLARTRDGLSVVAGLLALHLLADAAIELGHCIKHGQVDSFLSHDIPGFLMQATTLVVVLLGIRNAMGNGRGDPSRRLRLLGDISFPLFLVHIPIYMVGQHYGFQNPWAFYGTALLASLVMFKVLDRYTQQREARPVTPTPEESRLGAL